MPTTLLGPFNGNALGISKIATATPAAFCRACTGGSYSRKPNNIVKAGIGAQRHVLKGQDEVDLSVDCVGVALADVQKWMPTTVGCQMAAFPDFLVEVDDGVNGEEWVLTGCQPSSLKVSCGDGVDAEVEYSFGIKARLATDGAACVLAPVYHTASTQNGHTLGHVTCTIGGAATRQVLSWEFGVDLSLQMYNLQDGKTAGARTVPTGYVITAVGYSFSFVTAGPYLGDAMDGDAWTAMTSTIALSNGSAGQNQTYTLTGFVPDSFNMPLDPESMGKFAHEMILGDGPVVSGITAA
jgi:hypothetical protein